MKKSLLKAILFLFVNIMGFQIVPFLIIGISTFDLIDTGAPDFNPTQFEHDIVFKHYMTWMTCALFSFSFFFLKGIWRYLMLAAPFFIPLIYTGMNLMKYI